MPRYASKDLFFPQLQKISGIDCSTPKCFARGFCTGYLKQRSPLGWHIEYDCPDCKGKRHIHCASVPNLGEQVSLVDVAEAERLIKSSVKSRPRGPRPFSAPWP
jgi:hypothetical protein